MNSTGSLDLEHLRSFRQAVLDLVWWSDNEIEPIADRLAEQGNHDARWLANELLLACHTPDPGSLLSVSRALLAVAGAHLRRHPLHDHRTGAERLRC